MIQALLSITAATLAALGLFVWRARPASPINRWFAIYTAVVTAWTISIVGVHTGSHADAWGRLAFATASFVPAVFLAFSRYYPTTSHFPSTTILRLTFAIAFTFAALSVSTELVAYSFSGSTGELTRKTGPLYPLFAGYFLICWTVAAAVLICEWRTTRGLARAQLQYLGVAIIVCGALAITTNLLLPLLTGRSTYTWLGPNFGLVFFFLVAHAIIRHRLMDLRLVIHRGLTITIAMLMSLVPILIVLALFWPTLSDRFAPDELLILLLAIVGLSLLVAPTRDIAGKVLDKYVYRTQANFRRTVRVASQKLTRVLDLKLVLAVVSEAVADSTKPEGVAIYLRMGPRFSKATPETRHQGASFDAPQAVPAVVVEALSRGRDLLVTEEIARERTAESQCLHSELARLNWALVLPLRSEDTVIGLIALGPKLSWDPFYPQDLDLLMTLANQAGTAIKNAQLYTQVVLANEFIENVVATIESGVVAIDSAGHVTMFNRAAAQLTGLAAERVQDQSADVLPEDLGALLRSTVADGLERTQPEIALPDGTVTRPVICTTSPLRDPARVILGAVAVFSDLTPFKQLESERQRAARLAYFEVLASSLAHEIKNPLVAIKTFAQLIPRRQSDALFADEFSRIVTREIGRMEHLVEQLRTLSRPSDRPRQRLDVREPLAQAVESLRPAFDEKRMVIGTSLGAEPRFVLGDHGELEQLFINLLMNALEATPPDGTLSIELTATGDHVTVAVADSGPGIPAELLEHVFDPFITTKQRGSGLGLTICAGIAAAHRAKLRAANRAAGGALLTAEFPLAVAAQATSEVRDRDVNARA